MFFCVCVRLSTLRPENMADGHSGASPARRFSFYSCHCRPGRAPNPWGRHKSAVFWASLPKNNGCSVTFPLESGRRPAQKSTPTPTFRAIRVAASLHFHRSKAMVTEPFVSSLTTPFPSCRPDRASHHLHRRRCDIFC